MKYSYLLISILFILIIASCDECCIIPPCGDDEYATGDTLWIHTIPEADDLFIGYSLAIGIDQSIYYSAFSLTPNNWKNARIVALNSSDGEIKWTSETFDFPENSQIVVGEDGTIYVASGYKLYAIDHSSGSFKWIWEVPEKINNLYTHGAIGPLALTDSDDLILATNGAGGYNRALYGVDKNKNTTFNNLDATDGLMGGNIFIGANNTGFYYSGLKLNGIRKLCLVAVDVNSGTIKWYTEISGPGSASNNISVQNDGNLYCAFKKLGDDIYRHHVVNATNGNILWSGNEQSSAQQKWIGPDGELYELNTSILNHIENINGSQNPIVDKCEFGAITDNNRMVGAFTDADLKRKLGVFYPDGSLDYSVHMDGLLGDVIVISDDNVIYGIINSHPISRLATQIVAIQGNSPLARTGWPRPYHDNQNTFNWSK